MLKNEQLLGAIKDIRKYQDKITDTEVITCINVAERFIHGNITTDEKVRIEKYS